MFQKVEIEIDVVLVDQVVRRYGLHGPREAVNLALRSLLDGSADGDSGQLGEEYDEFSDPNAWEPKRNDATA